MSTLTREEKQNVLSMIPGVKPEERDTYERYVEALARISPILLPQRFVHPLRDQVMAGPSAFPELLSMFAKMGDDEARAVVLEAITLVIEDHGATPEVMIALEHAMRSPSGPIRNLATRGLALAGSEKLLNLAKNVLGAGNNNAEMRIAARLVGLGRYAPALPELMMLLSPKHFSLLDAVIWAIGRIGSEEALPILHAMLSSRVMVLELAEALGAIGSWSSLSPLLQALAGPTAEREALLRAIAELAARHGEKMRADAGAVAAKKILGKLIDEDPSETARYYAIVAHGALGGKIALNRFFTALGAQLPEKALDPMSAFFVSRAAKRR
jgi:HEAT repeat protein